MSYLPANSRYDTMSYDRYLHGISGGSRASKPHGFLRPEQITDDKLSQVRQLNDLAQASRQTLAQMALAWGLCRPGLTSVLIGASRVAQIDDAVGTLQNLAFSESELGTIEKILS
jgi:L-glyceraldehyde 3-phosphate reductase